MNRRVRDAIPELLRGRSLSVHERAIAAMMRSGLTERDFVETLAMTPAEISDAVASILAKARHLANDRSRRVHEHNRRQKRGVR